MTPDNSGFYHAAYIATAIMYAGYAVSIRVRARAWRARLAAATRMGEGS